jgi:hypothetical protein
MMKSEPSLEQIMAEEVRDAVDTLNSKLKAAFGLGMCIKIGMASDDKVITNVWGQPVNFSVISLTKTSEY